MTRRTVDLCLVVFAIPILASLFWAGASSDSSDTFAKNYLEEERIRTENERKRTRGTVNTWLEAQRKGQDGYEYWKEGRWRTPISFYAVREWQIVDDSQPREVIVRVHSSNKGGIPIIVLWKVNVIDGKILSVEQVENNSEGNATSL